MSRAYFGWGAAWAVVLTFAGAVATLAAPSKDEALRWRFVENETLVMRIVQEMNMDMKIGNGAASIPTSGTTQLDMSMHVDKVNDDGSARVTMKLARMKVGMKAAGMQIDFDSDDAKKKDGEKKEEGGAANEVSEMMAKAFGAMINLSYSATINPRGELGDIEVPEASLAALKGLPGMDALSGLFDEKTFKDSFSQMTGNGWLVLPEKEPAVGDTWKQETTMKNPVMGKQTFVAEFKYEGIVEKEGRKLDEFSVTIDMHIEPDPESKFPVKIDITKQEQKGKVYFDRALGRMALSELNTAMTMNLEAQGQQMEQEVKATTTTKFLAQDEAAADSPGDKPEADEPDDKPNADKPQDAEEPKAEADASNPKDAPKSE